MPQRGPRARMMPRSQRSANACVSVSAVKWSSPPTWSRATAGLPRLRSGRGHRFTHGDLQVTHVFVDVDEITGVVDWSEAPQGDALYDLASLPLGH